MYVHVLQALLLRVDVDHFCVLPPFKVVRGPC